MKLLKLLWLLAIIGLSLMPSTITSDTSKVVTITAQPWSVGGCPTNLVITMISEYEIQLSWTPGGNSTGTVLMAAYGRWPTAPGDGIEVYTGNDTMVTHWVNAEFIGVDIYYRAWGILPGGGYSICYASGMVQGGEAVATIGTFMGMGVFALLTLGFTLGGYISKKVILAVVAAASWLLLSVFSYTQSSTMWDIYYGTFFFAIFMVIVCIFEAVILNRKAIPATPSGDEMLSDEEVVDNETEELRKRAEGYRKRWRAPREKPFKW